MLTTEEFIAKARRKHGSKYDYSPTAFKDWDSRVLVACYIHGEFPILPAKHIYGKGQGCKKCGQAAWAKEKNRRARLAFVEKARAAHGDEYDYSLFVYVSAREKGMIICQRHGPFPQTPNIHLRGCGCDKCGNESAADKRATGTEAFILQARKVHGEKYDYSLVEYTTSLEPVTIICDIHGVLSILPSNHLRGHGCIDCGFLKTGDGLRKPVQEFLAQAREVHGERYDYSKVVYINCKTDVEIGCNKHGFFWQSPANHCKGSGCKLCGDLLNSKGIRRIESWLAANGIGYEREKTFDGLRSVTTRNQFLRYDFFVPDANMLIEFDGPQHFKLIEHWGGELAFRALVANDRRKNAWANERGYRLVRIGFTDEERIEEMLAAHLCSI